MDTLPIKLLRFWYLDGLTFFLRTLRHSVLFLEEDLTVELMWKLLFVPLFHDSTFVGRVLSFSFRLLRITLGLFAMLVVALILIVLALYWFTLPGLVFILSGNLQLFSLAVIFSGLVLFIHHLLSYPSKKLWQVKKRDNLWQASFIPKSEVNLQKLLQQEKVTELLSYLETSTASFTDWPQATSLDWVLDEVWRLGKTLGVPYLKAEYFFVASLICTPNSENLLQKLDLKSDDFIDVLDFFEKRNNWWRLVFVWDEDFQVRHLRGVNRGWLSAPTPTLDLVAEDLTRKAAVSFIPDFIGRSGEVSEVINILSMEKGRNVLLVGAAGSGKSELVNYLCKRIVSGDAPPALATKRVVQLDLVRLLDGVKTQGELAEKINYIFEEIKFSGNIIVFLDEIHTLGTGEVGAQYNLYNLLLPFIEGDDIQFISTTEPENYTRVIEKNSQLLRLFHKIDLPPASGKDTVEILKYQAIRAERYKKIKISTPAIRETVQLCAQYIKNQVLPDSALQLFEECLIGAEDGWVTKKVVEKTISSKVTVPVGEAGQEIKQQLLNLEQIIGKRMVGQEEAIKAVAATLRRAATDLRDAKRPIGSFLFVGPTGVGKTELAKTLVEEYFAGKGNFLRLDMSEYQTPEAVDRLTGDDGVLIDTVRNKPYTLILLDEFEKAEGKVLNLFLQVLDDGRLTSSTGVTVDFTNTIIIATSNAASLTIAQGLQQGKSVDQLNQEVRAELLKVFKPELVNRFDEVVIFKPLSPDNLQKIVLLKLEDLQNNLQEKGYDVVFSPDVIKSLAQKGYDPVLGARPLRRLIQDTVEANLSEMILAGKLNKGEKYTFNSSLLT